MFLSDINLGIRAHDLSASSLDEMLNLANNYGFSNLQFAPTKLKYLHVNDQLNYGQSRFFNKKIAKSNLEVSIIGCYVNIIANDNDKKSGALERFYNYLDMARYFDNAIVATETGSVSTHGYTEDNFKDEAFLNVVDSVKLMAQHAEQVGSLLAIEPGINHPVYNIKRTAELIKLVDSPNLKLIFDPVNLISINNYKNQNYIITEFLNTFESLICAVHLKDFKIIDNKVEVVSFGKGHLNKDLLMSQICKQLPQEYCLLESIKEDDISDAIKTIESIIY